MPLATKNNAIILKDGKLAENCGCCGGWWCYNQCADFSCPPSSVATVSISATDFVLNWIDKYTPNSTSSGLSPFWVKQTRVFKGSEIHGTHSLAYRPDQSSSTMYAWESTSSFWANCPYGGSSQMASNTIRLKRHTLPPARWDLYIPVTTFTWRHPNEYAEPSATGFPEPSSFSCNTLCFYCSALTGDYLLTARCDSSTGAISLTLNSFIDVPSLLPADVSVSFPTGTASSDYFKTTVYSSLSLGDSQQLPSASFTINSVTSIS